MTNQRGVGKGLMTEQQLFLIHDEFINTVNHNSGRIDKIYYCIDICESSINRKPNIGMALNAKFDYPDIDFKKSIVVGDSLSDMILGERLGMKRVLIYSDFSQLVEKQYYDFMFHSLQNFSENLCEQEC